MVGVFRRSLSFPNKMMINQNRPSKPPMISHHTRSISLPCRSHPLISQLREKVAELRSWVDSNHETDRRHSAWLVNGLSRLKDLHDCLDDTLQLPQTQESLRRQPNDVVENLLEDFLRFVDAYGIFQTSILALREEQSSAEVAIRKRDESKIVLYVKARKRMAKEMDKLVSAVRCIITKNNGRSTAVVCVGDAEIVDVVNDVVEVTVVVSLALFNGIAASITKKRGNYSATWMGLGFGRKKAKRSAKVEECVIRELEETEVRDQSLLVLRKKSDDEIRKAAKKMRELETILAAIETAGQRVFRALINSRVSLLNTLTQ